VAWLISLLTWLGSIINKNEENTHIGVSSATTANNLTSLSTFHGYISVFRVDKQFGSNINPRHFGLRNSKMIRSSTLALQLTRMNQLFPRLEWLHRRLLRTCLDLYRSIIINRTISSAMDLPSLQVVEGPLCQNCKLLECSFEEQQSTRATRSAHLDL